MRQTPNLCGLLLALVLASMASASTIYVDNAASMTADCTALNYSVSNRNCSATGTTNAYRTLDSAYAASGAGDTLRFRSGTYETGGQAPKTNQTWEGCRTPFCASNETPTLTTTGSRVINVSCSAPNQGPDGFTIRFFNIVGGGDFGILIAGSNNVTLQDLDISGWNVNGPTDYIHGAMIDSGGSGGACGIFAPHCCDNTGGLMLRLRVHDPAHAGIPRPGGFATVSGIALGGSGHAVRDSTIFNTDQCISIDQQAGSTMAGLQPFTIQNNFCYNMSNVCFHTEARSNWHLIGNVANGCGVQGIRIRPATNVDAGIGMSGDRYWNNTIYNASQALWVAQENPGEIYTDAQFKNNIFMSNFASWPTIKIGSAAASDPTVIFQGNLIRHTAGGAAVCWNDPSLNFSEDCTIGTYANTQAGLNQWDADNANVLANVVNGDPLFVDPNAANGGNFSLQLGSPAIDKGVNVGLPFSGSAPDLGARESTAGAPQPPKNLRIHPG